MTFNELLQKPQSKKITIVEIDSPIDINTLINYQPGIWFTRMSPGAGLVTDDRGNTGYWGTQNAEYFNIQSLNVSGDLYNEVSSIALCVATEQTWFYDKTTTDLYIHFDDWLPPVSFGIISPGAAIGFTNQVDTISSNYFEDVYYEPLITSIPNISKKKDALFFGVIQFSTGNITFNNAGGYFDDFSQRDLYGQPVRIKLSFEGLDISEQQLVYSGKVEDFTHNYTSFTLKVADARKTLSRELPINSLSLTDYPTMESKLDGTPIPVQFGPAIKAPTYKTSAGNWIFCDTQFNAVDFGIIAYKEDGSIFSHTGTETDGTFTGIDTDDDLYVSFTVSVVQNGLDIISFILENYENIEFNAFNYDIAEWNTEKLSVFNSGIWIGKGSLMSSVDVIEQICIDNNGIFDVLSDGRFTYRSYDPNRVDSFEIQDYEFLKGKEPKIDYESDEFLSSIKIEYSEDLKEDDPVIYTNSVYEDEVYGRYRNYAEDTVKTTLTNRTDATALSEEIMEQSKTILPKITLTTKTQNIKMRILDNLLYEYKRQNGKIILNRSSFQVLSIALNLSTYEMTFIIKQIKEVPSDEPDVPNYIFVTGNKTIAAGNYKLTPDGKRKIAIISRTEA